MFLVCNGLLVFVFNISDPIRNSSPSESTINSDEHAIKIGDIQKTELALMQSTKASYSVEQVVVEVDEEQRRETWQLVTVKEEEKEVSVARDHEGDQGEENGLITSGDHEENDLQGIELLSTEEFHKKCEEFIRKMREGIY
ncbi:hypothetical protein FNV43_RR12939 [Rhamnella rubrinervis]|uniref:Uncharacterized protein n=1 Tax=Rhamnella rubrinervis TaxID=2594499 RepID=A0A8K0MEG5_9ROSA|nr:hypothetical protein FNV43_RR12939 [Rhamnella rubrinervis]